MNIPLPKVVGDVGPGGPFITQQKAMNELRKLRAEADYAPYTEYANALSKSAYGQTAPANAIAALLQSPGAANMDSNLYNKLAAQGNASLQNYNPNAIPAPQGGGMGNSLAGNVLGGVGGLAGKGLNYLLNKIAPGMTNALNQNPMVAGQQPSAPQAGSTGQTPGYSTPFSQQTAGTQVPGSAGVNNPTDVNAANRAGMNAAATGQAGNQVELQRQRSAAISQQATTATQALKLIDAFSRNYDKSSYKGQFIGNRAEEIPTLPGGTVAPEQLANRYASEYLTTLAGLGDTPAGKTDEGRSLIAAGKFDLSLDPDAKKELVESTKAKLNRMVILRDFANDFIKNNPGATDEQLVAMMNAYNRYAPSYDYENGKKLPQNDKKFRDFTSAQALDSYRQNGDYNPYLNKEKGTVEKVYDLTKFNNDAEFNKWYADQNKDTQEYVKRQIKAGVY